MSVISMDVVHAHRVTSPVLQVGDTSASSAVVFLHGTPGCAAEWADLLQRTGTHGRAVALDMPGYGGARTFAGFDHRVEGDYRAFLADAIDTLGIERVHLVGHDFGGPWGLAWAAAHPDRLASLTLINTGAVIDYRWHRYARMFQTPVIGELSQALMNRRGMHMVLRRSNPRLPTEFIDQMYDNLDRHTRETVLALYRAARDPDAMLAESVFTLPTQVPTLVVWGGADPWLPAKHADDQPLVWPSAKVHVLDGLGHWPHADDPDAVAALLLPFLQEQLQAG